MIGTAAVNLSFLYLLEGDIRNAEKYADIAVTTDRYNAKAHTNRGNCYFNQGGFYGECRVGEEVRGLFKVVKIDYRIITL